MPRQYSGGGRQAPGSAEPPPSGGPTLAKTRSFKERVGALKNLRPFIAMVWQTSPQLTAASLVLRLVRALLPVATLFIGKLIIDEVVLLVQRPGKPGHAAASGWTAGFSTGWAFCWSPNSPWPCWRTFSAASSR